MVEDHNRGFAEGLGEVLTDTIFLGNGRESCLVSALL